MIVELAGRKAGLAQQARRAGLVCNRIDLRPSRETSYGDGSELPRWDTIQLWLTDRPSTGFAALRLPSVRRRIPIATIPTATVPTSHMSRV